MLVLLVVLAVIDIFIIFTVVVVVVIVIRMHLYQTEGRTYKLFNYKSIKVNIWGYCRSLIVTSGKQSITNKMI